VNNTHIASAHAWDVEADGLFLFRRGSELDPAEGADRDDQRVGRLVPRIRHVERHHPEAGLGLDVLEDEARVVGELDLDDRLLDPVGLGERGDRLVEPVDERLHQAIASFAEANGVEKPLVEVELADTSRFVLERIEPEPGFGMVTLYVTDARDDAPDALIVPIGSLRRIELSKSPDDRVQRFGFSVPLAD